NQSDHDLPIKAHVRQDAPIGVCHLKAIEGGRAPIHFDHLSQSGPFSQKSPYVRFSQSGSTWVRIRSESRTNGAAERGMTRNPRPGTPESMRERDVGLRTFIGPMADFIGGAAQREYVGRNEHHV